jgi:methylthioribulose-1-phosphate dehydratase
MHTVALPELSRQSLEDGLQALRQTGAQFYQRGWSLGTSSNYSILLQREPQTLLITASGKDKSRLNADSDFVLVDHDLARLPWPFRVWPHDSERPIDNKPSAETALHLMLTRRPGVGSVLHTHSVWGTLLSDVYGDQGGLWIEGYEMLKGLAGVATHQHREWVPIFANSQDIGTLAKAVQATMDNGQDGAIHGILLRAHGLYTWGRDVTEARRHVEIFEFLFEVLGRRLMLK